MLAIMERAGSEARVRAMLSNPYALVGDGSAHRRDAAEHASDARGVKRVGDEWTAPFAMGIVNSRVVHRTNALLDYPWGRDFRYEERVAMGTGARGFARATAMSAGLAASAKALTLSPVRALAKGRLPSPGEGPSKEKRTSGSFEIRVTAEDGSGASCTVAGQGDPGYTGAAKMLVESALCLSRDVRGPGGVVTPAACMGHALAVRLRAVAITFDVRST
jgi:short subunit dehydrogenase-like uncharacterized protein